MYGAGYEDRKSATCYYYKIYYDSTLPNPGPLQPDTKFLQHMYDALETLAAIRCMGVCAEFGPLVRQGNSSTLMACANAMHTCRLASVSGLQAWKQFLEQIEIHVLNRGLGRWGK